ncbi:hypothetical protein BP6252_09119 [Coleophoma cylindrospora]|uniref:C2H2-type domain-containing protein n=1 Tax=Coleophoma cylindrospora TaxID=1849047 RepID=A0A3D8R103_9HELO|nr:hypothetical protein BP6252_09119 [Coleophoma cylindrospora]
MDPTIGESSLREYATYDPLLKSQQLSHKNSNAVQQIQQQIYKANDRQRASNVLIGPSAVAAGDDDVISCSAPSLTNGSSNSRTSSVNGSSSGPLYEVLQHYRQPHCEFSYSSGCPCESHSEVPSFESHIPSRPRITKQYQKSKLSAACPSLEEDLSGISPLIAFGEHEKTSGGELEHDNQCISSLENQDNVQSTANLNYRNTSLTVGTGKTMMEEVEPEESEEDTEYDDDDDDDDESSNGSEKFEAQILRAVDYDYNLAAFLIKCFPRAQHQYQSMMKSRTIDGWRNGITRCTTDSGDTSSLQNSSSSNAPTNGKGSDRKRRGMHQHKPDQSPDDNHEDEDDGERDSKRLKDNPGCDDNGGYLLACPFNKKEPSKFCIQQGDQAKTQKKYKTCSGSGFKDIQRLKEHLKRVHRPAQCDRCYWIAPSVQELQTHRRNPEPCPINPDSMKEGINEVQWTSLEIKAKTKRSATSDLQKWNEIWGILFPTIEPPSHPYFESPSNCVPADRSKEIEDALQYIHMILYQKIRSRDLKLEPEGDQGIEIVLNAFRQGLQIFSSLGPHLAGSSTSCSSTENPWCLSSLLGGSYRIVGSTSRNSRISSAPTRIPHLRATGQPLEHQQPASIGPHSQHLHPDIENQSMNYLDIAQQQQQQQQQQQHANFSPSMDLGQQSDTHRNPDMFPEDYVNISYIDQMTMEANSLVADNSPWGIQPYSTSGPATYGEGQAPSLNPNVSSVNYPFIGREFQGQFDRQFDRQ